MVFRFVHSADVHLDSPLKSLALRHAELGALISNATREAFARTVTLCLDEAVDALLLAGDLYDGDQTSMKTARFFADQMRRLDKAGVRVFILRGNHDALSKITKELVLPPSVKVFGGWAEAVPIDRDGALPDIVIHGLSFASPKAPDGLLPKYKAPVQGAVNIGLMHTSLGGAPGHDNYAPCSVVDLEGSGFHYWALGHIHKRSVAIGKCTIVMPGNPQGRDINESGAKSVSLVTVADDGTIEVEERHVSVAQFERVTVDLTGVDDWRNCIEAIATALKTAKRVVASDNLVVRLHLIGETSISWQLRRDLDLLQTEVDVQGDLIGSTWVEKIEIACAPAGGETADAGDTVAELRQLIAEQVAGSGGFLAEIETYADDLLKALPPEVRARFGTGQAEYRSFLKSLVAEGADDVLARIQKPRDKGAV